MSVPLPTLLELSMRMVLQKDLPWDTYPPLKEDFEALERLPGNYKVVKESEGFLKKDEVVPSSELTPWEAEVCVKLKSTIRYYTGVTAHRDLDCQGHEWRSTCPVEHGALHCQLNWLRILGVSYL